MPVADLDPSFDYVWAIASDPYNSRCHSRRPPEEFSANQWPSVLKIRTKCAGFTAAQAAQVAALLQNRAKDHCVRDAFTAAVAAEPVVAEPSPVPETVGAPALPEYPRVAGQSAEYAYKQMLDFRDGARSNAAFGMMKNITADLSDADITALACCRHCATSLVR